MSKKNLLKRIVYILVVDIMAIQILLGFIWMGRNILAIPLFGDSTEYLNLSQTFMLDEYRPVMYPLILRIITEICERIPIPYQVIVYIMQTIISFLSIWFTVYTVDKIMFNHSMSKKYAGIQCFISLYLMTIPMITFMNFTVLTDSLANSMLLLSLAGLVYVYWYDHVSVKIYIMIIISLIIGCLLRADRLYSCLLLVVIAFLVRIIRKSAERKQIISAMLVVCLLTVGVTKGVDSLTQTPGINGRIQTNFEFVLLDRIVWPNMSNNYEYFSDEIKSVISLEEAQTFDQHNNNVMYQMAPLVEARVGKEEAKNIYREMAKVVFLHQPGKVVFDIAEDIFTMLITPISSYMHLRGKWSKNDGWNVYCMSSVDSEGTTIFLSYYHYTFMLLLAVGVLRYAIMRKKMCVKEQFHKFVSVLLPFFGMGIILTLWFSIGDGAPPNDRYALLIYIIWSLVTIGLLGAGKRLPGTKE